MVVTIMSVSNKTNKMISLIFLFFLLYLFITPVCEASTKYGYEVYALPDKDVSTLWEYYDITMVKKEITDNRSVVNFAISTDEYVAILTTDDAITIFDESGNVYRRFEFYDSGTSYVGWNGNNVLLFSIRGNNIIEFTLDGDCVDIVELSSDYGISIWDDITRSTSVETTKYTYELSKNMGKFFNFFSGYTYNTLTKTDVSGNTTIIYDVNTFQIAKSIIILLSIIIVICTVPAIIVFQVRKNMNNISFKEMKKHEKSKQK